MRRVGLLLLPLALVAAFKLASGLTRAAGFSLELPADVPTAAVLANWQKITGDVDTPTEAVSYVFYVNPVRQALYEVTRYRVTRLSPGPDGKPQRRPETEKLLWNAHPGTGELLRCYELREPGGWVRMEQGTPEYRAEMMTAIHVYGLHRAATQGREP